MTRLHNGNTEKVAAAFEQILQAIREGERVDHTCAAHGIDRRDLWAYWSRDPERRAQWYDAMRESADAYVDMLRNIADGAGADPKAARVQAGVYQWIAEKRDPERYGQRVRADVNVKSVDLTKIIQDANARLLAQRSGAASALSGVTIDSNTGAADALAHTSSSALPDASRIEHAALFAAGLL